MGKLFGTDGIRGVANRDLTPELAYKIGRIAAYLLGREESRPLFVIGRDTRLSGTMLEGSLVAGITSTGAVAHLLGVASTPAVSFATRRLQATAGVVISASHNPIEYNGLKIFDRRGMKLPDTLEEEIEKVYLASTDDMPRPEGDCVGQALYDHDSLDHYLSFLKETAPSLDGMRLVVDCGHGACCRVAEDLLRSLGAAVVMLHDTPDGGRINVNCGATDTADLQQEVIRVGANLGLAFDGDADRLIAVDEKGNQVDGDAVMAICALDLVRQGRLKNNTLVATVMSNGGLDILGEEHGFSVIRTAVGDRFVLERMLAGGYNLGGEQSGHVIFADYSTTGDGLLTALQLLKVVRRQERPLSELASRLTRLPQVLHNQVVRNQEGWEKKEAITAAVREVEAALGRYGRVLVRASGTEPLIRVMLEAPLPEDKLREYAQLLAGIIVREQAG
ncbi:MAG: phosphoglucosamine mutase [Bacillota bacterium]